MPPGLKPRVESVKLYRRKAVVMAVAPERAIKHLDVPNVLTYGIR